MLREEMGMMFAVDAMRRGLEVGGRWERIGVESAHELRWNAEVEVMVGGSNTTRIAHIVRVMIQKERNKEKKRGRENFGIRQHVLSKGGLTSKEEGADRGSGWRGMRDKRKGGFHSLRGL